LSIGADHGDRDDWILSSGRDPSTFFIDKINKFLRLPIAATPGSHLANSSNKQDAQRQLSATI
jgi:hypothetical protein